MAEEIERKFLVPDAAWREHADSGVRYRQGYLNDAQRCSVRVRVTDTDARLNIKSATLGAQRREYEYPIPRGEAAEILADLRVGELVEKVRYAVRHAGHVWEVDVFEGPNSGLVVAEIELDSVDEPFSQPPWVGREVTRLARYYNARLAEHPYRDWSEAERRGDG